MQFDSSGGFEMISYQPLSRLHWFRNDLVSSPSTWMKHSSTHRCWSSFVTFFGMTKNIWVFNRRKTIFVIRKQLALALSRATKPNVKQLQQSVKLVNLRIDYHRCMEKLENRSARQCFCLLLQRSLKVLSVRQRLSSWRRRKTRKIFPRCRKRYIEKKANKYLLCNY